METTEEGVTEGAVSFKNATFIAINPQGYGGYYGKGFSVAEAKANMKAQPGARADRFVVYALPEGVEDAYLNHFGQVCWTWAEGYDGPRQISLEVVAKRGVTL